MNVGKISTSVLLSFLIIMFMTVNGCGHKDATSVISGDVTGNITANVTINITGDITSSTTTDAGGNFSFGSMENGYYTVTPYLDGYTFNPASNAITVSGASVSGVNFVSTFTGYSVSGNVTLDGVGLEGVTIAGNSILGSGNVTTTSDGSYSFSNAITTRDFVYATLTPYLDGYTFTPRSTTIGINGASVNGINFTSEFTGYSISGTIIGNVVANVTLTLSGAGSGMTTTIANGSYAFTNITSNGLYIVTPSLGNYIFIPSSSNVTINGASVTGIAFNIIP